LWRGVGDGGGQPRADVEAVVGERDSGVEQLTPAGLAVLGVDVLQEAHDAGHPDGAARCAGVGFGFGPVRVGNPSQVVLGRCGRRDLAAVVGLDRIGGRVVVEQESAAANA
jgi:hypothetical protein